MMDIQKYIFSEALVEKFTLFFYNSHIYKPHIMYIVIEILDFPHCNFW